MWCKVRVQLHFLAYEYPVFPAPLVGRWGGREMFFFKIKSKQLSPRRTSSSVSRDTLPYAASTVPRPPILSEEWRCLLLSRRAGSLIFHLGCLLTASGLLIQAYGFTMSRRWLCHFPTLGYGEVRKESSVRLGTGTKGLSP